MLGSFEVMASRTKRNINGSQAARPRAGTRWSRAALQRLAPGLCLLLALAAVPGCSRGPRDDRWNVLLITLDTTRADRLGAYGYEKEVSPNLDSLAEDGIRFDFAISTAGITPIAHASILTGLNPYRHGVRVFHGTPGSFLDAGTTTLASLLAEEGYETGAFVSAYPASERFGLDWGFDTFDNGARRSALHTDPDFEPKLGVLRNSGEWVQKPKVAAQRRADSVTDDALRWLRRARGPFFQWVHYFDPHDAFLVPPKDYLKTFDARRNGPDRMSRVYDADVLFMDHHIGRLLDAYREKGVFDRTIVIVMADHGQGLDDHDWEQHRLLYREQIRIPLLVRWPEGPRAAVVPELVRNTDILPTVTELLGIEHPAGLDGRSFLGLATGEEDEPRLGYAEALNTLDAHAPRALPARQKDLLFCVVDQDWKLIHHMEKPKNSELYDLRRDPGELENVFDEHPEQVARLMTFIEESGCTEMSREAVAPMEEEAVLKLRSLGYTGDD